MSLIPSFRHPAARAFLASAALAGMLALAPSAFAAGGNSDPAPAPAKDATAKKPQADLTTCDKGKLWDVKLKKCVDKQGSLLGDPALTEYAYALAKAARYQEAIETLDSLSDPNTPRALNYRGYATRKLGRTDEGIGYYLKSVALDPSYIQVREYLGEAYLIKGETDLAKAQLATIETLCGSETCEEYGTLEKAIAKGKGW